MLQEGVDTCSVRELSPRYVLFENRTGRIDYEEIRRVMRSPQFSYGNFCYHISREADGKYVGDSLQFVIREPMLQICPHKSAEEMQYYPEYRCVYMVCSIPELSPVEWKLDKMYEYAEKEGISCGSEAYAFYVYSIMGEEKIVDYYEIFLPILK